MQLSIEAIIILVIAFTLLGFGIVFVKNVFTKAGGSVDTQLGQATSVCNTANGNNPIIPDGFEVEQGGNTKQDVCVFNNAANPITSGQLKALGCIDPAGNPVTDVDTIKFISAPLDVTRGDAKTLKTTVAIKPATPLGTYICNVQFEQSGNTEAAKRVGPIQMTFEVQ
jgi:hypothetical protein